jgi:hypothetical protein
MRLARRAVKVLLSILVLFEAYSAWQFWRHGPPMVVTGVREMKPDGISFRMTPAPLTALDYLVLVIVIALQVALVWFLWWSKRRVARG